MGSLAYSNFAHQGASNSPDHDNSSVCVSAFTEHRQNSDPRPERLVRAVQAARRRRVALFDADLFSDPAWDILLELYAMHLEQQRASVSGLYAASSVPGSTALRWVAKLERDGLVVRTDDSLDARRSWIKLTEDGVARMRRFFEMLPLATISV